ncbi:uncharacterized protein V6R79_005822 [Siganus canaliculatus]
MLQTFSPAMSLQIQMFAATKVLLLLSLRANGDSRATGATEQAVSKEGKMLSTVLINFTSRNCGRDCEFGGMPITGNYRNSRGPDGKCQRAIYVTYVTYATGVTDILVFGLTTGPTAYDWFAGSVPATTVTAEDQTENVNVRFT